MLGSKRYETPVQKATSSKGGPPKQKHVRTLILYTHEDMMGVPFLTEIFKRRIESDEIIAWKTVITMHKVFQEGHRKVLEDANSYYSLFDGTYQWWLRQPTSVRGLYQLITNFWRFLIDKMLFHKSFPGLVGDFDPEKCMKVLANVNSEKKLSLVTGMMDLQDSMKNIYSKITSLKPPVDDTLAACLPGFVIEAFNLYTLEVFLLKKLVAEVDNVNVLTMIIERFYSQFVRLKNFFADCSNVKYVTDLIAVPTLPKNAPEFTLPKKPSVSSPRAKRNASPVRGSSGNNLNQQKAAAGVQQQIPKPVPVVAPTMPAQPASNFDSSNPFSNAYNPFENQPKQTMLPPPKISANPVQPQQANKSDAFSALNINSFVSHLSESQKQHQEEEKRKKEEQAKREHAEEERRQKEWELRQRLMNEQTKKLQQSKELEEKQKKQKEEEERKRKEEDEKDAQRQASIKKQQDEENKKRFEAIEREKEEKIKKIAMEASSKEITELKMRIVELEQQLENEKQKSSSLQKELNESRSKSDALKSTVQKQAESYLALSQKATAKEGDIASMKAELDIVSEQRENLSKQLVVIQAENSKLNEQLSEQNQHSSSDATALLVRQIGSAKEFIENTTHRLDNPNNLGNVSATIASIIEYSNELFEQSQKVVSDCNSGNQLELVDSLQSTMNISLKLMDDVKGTARRVEDEGARQKMLDAGRDAMQSLSRLLESVLNLEGQPESEEEKAALQNDLNGLGDKTKALIDASKATEKKIEEFKPEELESLAERELLAAAKVIEDAAKALMQAKNNQPKVEIGGTTNIANAILEAAMAVTKATGLLVQCATEAQRERIKLGLESGNPASYYKKNSWAQGLVSAAKAVAFATSQLVTTANDAVEGKVEGEAVISASKEVAAATAQLVASTRSRDNSPTQRKLEEAAKAIANATSLLVNAAKNAKREENNQKQLDVGSLTQHQRKIKKMELQTAILKMEKEMQQVQNELYSIQKAEYDK